MVAIQWLNFFDLMRFWVCFCPLMLKDPPDLVTISEKCEKICVLDIINLQSMDGFPVFLSQSNDLPLPFLFGTRPCLVLGHNVNAPDRF